MRKIDGIVAWRRGADWSGVKSALHEHPQREGRVTVPHPKKDFPKGTLRSVAIECHVKGLLIDGETVPLTKTVEHYRARKDFSNVWALVEVDILKFSGKAKRVNITLPEHLLSQIDSFAARTGGTRSGLLADAALEYVAGHSH